MSVLNSLAASVRRIYEKKDNRLIMTIFGKNLRQPREERRPIMEARVLLNEVTSISKKYQLINEKTGKNFNIFRILGNGTAEVAICRVMHELLDPYGSHGQGDIYLRSFVHSVLQLEFTEKDFETAQVYREYVIDENRRIDLYIKTRNHAIPIEVKIYAKDQAKQCEDYYRTAVNSPIYYLTPTGSMPTEESLGSLKREDIQCISFRESIVSWIEKCITLKETVRLSSIREVLWQYLDTIKLFTNQVGDEQEMEIQQLLASSSQNMKSALQIESSINETRILLMKRLFQALETGIEMEKLHIKDDYAYNDYKRTKDYYAKGRSGLPGLHYVYKKDIVEGNDLWFSIEIDDYLYAGFYLNAEDEEKEYLAFEDIQALLPHIEKVNRDGLYLHWEYLPLHEEEKPNFRLAGLSDSYSDLFDEAEFQAFVERCLEDIHKLLNCHLSND